ncbi:MAG TPA: hypothetical protein PKA44_09325 [Saprospiraceae bacterium]|nr:hypothetical protein [Saprospiraceae bacterium]
MSNRLDKDREAELQPKRIEFAIEQLAKVGIEIDYEDDTKIKFMYKGEVVTLFPYSGWHTGKSIQDGRGLKNLLKQLQ